MRPFPSSLYRKDPSAAMVDIDYLVSIEFTDFDRAILTILDLTSQSFALVEVSVF